MTIDAFPLPSFGASRRPRISAPAASSALRAIIRRWRAVRRAAVSGSPTAGGLAGYLKNGIRVTVTNRAAVTSAAVARGPKRPMRPSA